jgi:guanylate kinase
LMSEIDRIWNSGKHIIFDIDVQGLWPSNENLESDASPSLSNRQAKNFS